MAISKNPINYSNFKEGIICHRATTRLGYLTDTKINSVPQVWRSGIAARVIAPFFSMGALTIALALRIASVIEPIVCVFGDIVLAIKEGDSSHLLRIVTDRPKQVITSIRSVRG